MTTVNTKIQKPAEASLNNLASFCVLKDLKGKYLWANQQFCDAFQLPTNQVVGKYNTDFFYPACSQEINATDKAIADERLHLTAAYGCLITRDDRIFQIMGTKRKIATSNNEFGIMGDCFILEHANPIKVFLDERITTRLNVDSFECLNITQLKIIYCLLAFPNVKLREIAHLLCIANNTIYKEIHAIKTKLGEVSKTWLLKKMQQIGFFDTFFWEP